MAQSEIVAKLKLNADDYNAKLDKAKQSTKKFGKDGASAFGGIAEAAKKMLPAITAAIGGQQAFQRALQSSQAVGDAYTRAIESAKASVDEFFYSVTNGDFSGFINGLQSVISNAKAAASAMDQLGNTKWAYDFLASEEKTDFRFSLTAAKDKNKSTGERKAALANAEGYLKSLEEKMNVYVNDSVAAMLAQIASKSNVLDASQFSLEDVKRVVEVDVSKTRDEEKKALAQQYQEYLSKLNDIQSSNYARSGTYVQTSSFGTSKLVENKSYDPERVKKEMDQLNAGYKDAVLYNAILNKGTDEWLQGVLGIYTGVMNTKRELAEYNTSILEARNAVGALAPDTSTKVKKDTGVGTVVKPSTGDADITLPDKLPEIPPIKPLEEIKSTSNEATDAIGGLSQMMGSLSGVMGEGAGAWLGWSANVLQAIGQAIPAITALTAANKAKATAAAEAAGAEGAGAVAGIPIAGPAMAVAAVASIVAALASIPKFATGGIVPGTSFSGDNMLIRANSGEMVLTRDQQNLLSDRINGGGQVEFVIKGSNLVGILNGHKKIKSRSYGV